MQATPAFTLFIATYFHGYPANSHHPQPGAIPEGLCWCKQAGEGAARAAAPVFKNEGVTACVLAPDPGWFNLSFTRTTYPVTSIKVGGAVAIFNAWK